MKGFKAFHKGLKCKGFEYIEGETYETERAVICREGFHFCENPLDVLNYYDLCDSEFAEVEALGEIDKREGDTKCATTKIKIGAKLSLTEFVKCSVKFLLETCKPGNGDKVQASAGNSSQLAASGDYGKLAASGDYSQLASAGNSSQLAASGAYSKLASAGYSSQLAASGAYSKLAASGDYGKLAASGYSSQLASAGNSSQLAASGAYSKLAASGDYGKLAASGYSSQLASAGNSSKLEIKGKYSVGAAIGINNRISATKGCWITLAEWQWDGKRYIPVCVKSAQIDGKNLKEDTWYTLKGGEFTEIN